MKIIPLSEGSFTIDKSKLFIPFDADNDDLQARPMGSLLVEVQPFALVTSEDVLLLDTGLGFEKNGVLQIHKNLMHNGINPSEVTKVFMTHLHKDHAGGSVLTRKVIRQMNWLSRGQLIIFKSWSWILPLTRDFHLILRQNSNV